MYTVYSFKMSDSELSDAPPARPDDSVLASTLRRVVRDALKKSEELTVRIARSRAEEELGLESDFFKKDEWKDRSKEIINAAVEEPSSPVKEKPKAGRKRKSEEPAEKPKKRAKKSPVMESDEDELEEEEEGDEEGEEDYGDSEEEERPKPKSKAKAKPKAKPQPKPKAKPKTKAKAASPVVESDDEEEDESPKPKAKPQPKPKAKPKTKAKAPSPIVELDEEEEEEREEEKKEHLSITINTSSNASNPLNHSHRPHCHRSQPSPSAKLSHQASSLLHPRSSPPRHLPLPHSLLPPSY